MHTFWLFVAPGLLLGLYAQARINANYVRYSRVGTSGGIAGAQVARALLDAQGFQRVQIESTPGMLRRVLFDGESCDPKQPKGLKGTTQTHPCHCWPVEVRNVKSRDGSRTKFSLAMTACDRRLSGLVYDMISITNCVMESGLGAFRSIAMSPSRTNKPPADLEMQPQRMIF